MNYLDMRFRFTEIVKIKSYVSANIYIAEHARKQNDKHGYAANAAKIFHSQMTD